ncbi:TetR/AcrR family transcriptional regulator C-terminal domain-containing protein [Streptomyces sp. MUM 136J]|uniref:nucleotide disphospho-sugar-binding domain-containing protein n=1 Tax=Streptomyces sp. MUM 136J TaxID=2791992 RepID=UPI0023D8E31C|nr:nucleotide disphospho-sugar-binding domain-containing protein [Streptomyces sp. MUM 136J]MCH0570258.1 TetR/AcrR family transcriptional regulator C-terminal domain-containing protein [Streptomyces sp. MUM 136J]
MAAATEQTPEVPPLIWAEPEPDGALLHPPLTRPEVVAALLRIADSEGLTAVSLERLTAELGTAGVSLRHHIRRPGDLEDLLIDGVFAELALSEGRTGEWRADMRAGAYQLREAIGRHPWFARLTFRRPLFGPQALGWLERTMAVLEGAGLDVIVASAYAGIITGHVMGTAMCEAEEAEMEQVRAGERSTHERHFEAMHEGLAALVDRWRPHAIVHEPVAFAAEAIAAARGIPCLRHLWGPDVFGTPQGAWLRERARELVAAEVHGGVQPSAAQELVIDPCPAPMQRLGPGAEVPIRFVPVDRPGTVPSWLLDPPERERICVTWGTFTDGVPGGHPLMHVVRGLARPGTEVVVAVRAEDLPQLGELPPGAKAVTGVPLHAVLSSCTAVVHHGGANTALGAVARGLPQLVVSDTFERALNGGRLAEAGVGLHLDSQDADADTVGTAVRRLVTDDQYARAAAALRLQALSRPSPAQVAGGFEELIARYPVPSEPIAEGA